jgi:hypothetical protein
VLVAGLVLVLAGCSEGDPEPRMAPTESVASTPSTSAPTVSPSVDPTVDPLSPEETVRAWVKARNAALQDGDTDAVRALSSSSCESCFGLIEPIEEIYSSGGNFETKGWRVAAAKERGVKSYRANVDTALVFAGGRTVSEAGAPPVRYGPEKHIVVFKLVRLEAGWRVQFLGFLS